MRAVRRHVVALTCVLVVGGFGCAARRSAETPEATLAAFAAALERGDVAAAYELLSKPARAQLPREEFARKVRDNPAEIQALAADLRGPGRPHTLVHVPLRDGREVTLEQSPDGSWRLGTSQLTDFYSQQTPRAALASFVRAVENERWDVVLDLMPENDRAGLDAATLAKNLKAQQEELTRLVALLKSSLDAPIEIVGDRATMPYGESFTARFVREKASWKLEDPE
jgi:hypothetical protein